MKSLFKLIIILVLIFFVFKIYKSIIKNNSNTNVSTNNITENSTTKKSALSRRELEVKEEIIKDIKSKINTVSNSSTEAIKVVSLDLERRTENNYFELLQTNENGLTCNYPVIISITNNEYTYSVRKNKETMASGCSL